MQIEKVSPALSVIELEDKHNENPALGFGTSADGPMKYGTLTQAVVAGIAAAK